MSLKRPSDFAPRLVPRDGKDRPLVVPLEGGRPKAHTRVTTYIKGMTDETGINDWRTKILLRTLAEKPELLDRVRAIEPGSENEHKRLLAVAEQVHAIGGGNEAQERGTRVHLLTEAADLALPFPDDAREDEKLWIPDYVLATDCLTPSSVERLCVNVETTTAGTPDRTYEYSGPGPKVRGKVEHVEGLFIGDVKTGGFDHLPIKTAMQMAIYARAHWYDHTVFPYVDRDDEKALNAYKQERFSAEQAAAAYSPVGASTKWGILVHLTEDGCTLYWLDLELGWEAVLAAGERRRTTARPGRFWYDFVADVTEVQEVSQVAPAA